MTPTPATITVPRKLFEKLRQAALEVWRTYPAYANPKAYRKLGARLIEAYALLKKEK